MFPVTNTVPNFRGLSFLGICPEELNGSKASCVEHCAVAEEHRCPSGIRNCRATNIVKNQHFVYCCCCLCIVAYISM